MKTGHIIGILGLIVGILSLIVAIAEYQMPDFRMSLPSVDNTASPTYTATFAPSATWTPTPTNTATSPDTLLLSTEPLGIQTTAVSSQDFIFETSVTFDASQNYEGAGIIALLPNGGQINYALAYCDEENCTNRGIYVDVLETENFDSVFFRDFIPYDSNTIDLRLVSQNNGEITLYLRPTSGDSWQQFTSFKIDVPIDSVGLVAQTSVTGINVTNIPPKLATFDDYSLTMR